MAWTYTPYGGPGGKCEEWGNHKMNRLVQEIKANLTPREAEQIIGLEYPYTNREFDKAILAAFPSNERLADDNACAYFYAIYDILCENGSVWDHIGDEAWLAEFYGDDYYDDDDGDGEVADDDSFLPVIAALTRRQHSSSAQLGNVFDTGIHGTGLRNIGGAAMETFLEDLAEHGPFAFILNEPGVYDVACVDSPYHLCYGVWEGPAIAPNLNISTLRGVDQDGLHYEYNIASTIDIMIQMGFEHEEIEAFLQGNEEDYNDGISWYMVNDYLHSNWFGVRNWVCDNGEFWPFK